MKNRLGDVMSQSDVQELKDDVREILAILRGEGQNSGLIDQVNDHEKYIQDQIEKKEQTLNRFMAEKFGLQSRESYDPDAYDDPESKMVAATLAMFSSGRLEDFSIDLAAGQEKQDEEITSAIEEYYKNQGYEIEMGTWDNMFVTKGEQSLMVVFTNYGDSIQVSVQDMKNL